jgi:hypothetical protein
LQFTGCNFQFWQSGNRFVNYCVVKLTRIIYSGTLLLPQERYVQ